MLAVLLVLLALFVLSAPFLLTARNADQASAELADRSLARLALDSAERHARAGLSPSHRALDRTPYSDSQDELSVENAFPAGFLDANDPHGVMWDVEVEDVAGKIDLASAPPQVFANLLGAVARVTEQVTPSAKEIPVNSTAGFLSEGAVFVSGMDADRELVYYTELDGSRFGKVARGLGVKQDGDGNPQACGPRPPHVHPVGAYVLDQRAFAIPLWRIAHARSGELAALDSLEQANEAAPLAIAGTLGPGALEVLARTTSPHAALEKGARFGRGARLVNEPEGEPPQGCKLAVDDARRFNAGTTVRIRDGHATEFALVVESRPRGLLLAEPLANAFRAYEAVVEPLVRAPVDVNTASPEVLKALFWNLKLKAKSARITAEEANTLVEVVVASRPFAGLEDFLRRVVLPAGGLEALPADAPVVPDAFAELAQQGELGADGERAVVGFLDPEDAVALYKNALDANDAELEFSTLPFSFVSRDRYALELRASVNAASGVERARGLREVALEVVPQRDLLEAWARQEDFEEAVRLPASAPWWLTGPEATYRFDPIFGSACPSRARAHLGPHDTSQDETRKSASSLDVDVADAATVITFPSRDESAFAQLAPARADEEAPRARRALHFDDETRDVESRYLPDGTLRLDPSKEPVSWGSGGVMPPFSCELWVKPRVFEEGAILLDAGGSFTDSDRVTLAFEGGDLVFRVLDGAGDHPRSEFEERSEIRYSLANEGPGMPQDVWTHVEVAAQGNRPDQMRMLVDGRASARTPGMTRLTTAVQPDSDRLPVESTEGFPDRCALRIGDEIVEATKAGETSFEVRHATSGDAAGFGGRLARERFDLTTNQALPEQNMGLVKDTAHPEGATVELYGYSLPLYSNVPSSGGSLATDLGGFGVARVAGIVVGGSEKREEQMEPILLRTSSGDLLPYGWGMDGKSPDVEALVLEPADGTRQIADLMNAFGSGGYAALLSIRWRQGVQDRFGTIEIVDKDQDGTRLGGVEIVRFAGIRGNQLLLQRRGDAVPELANLRGADPDLLGGRASFVFHFVTELDHRNESLRAQVLVIPISVPVRGASGAFSFLPAIAGASQFAQITRVGAESALTEWVRYDEIPSGTEFLVRDDPTALLDANLAAHAGLVRTGEQEDPLLPEPPGGPGGGGFQPPGPPRGASASQALLAVVPGAPAAPAALAPQQVSLAYWHYAMGEPEFETEAFPVTRAVSSQFQFRGVMGTYSHSHPGGASVLPVFKVLDVDEQAGRPGRFDHVMFLDPDPGLPAFPGVVHHVHRPFDYWTHSYSDGGTPLTAVPGPTAPLAQKGFDVTATYVALDQALAAPISASALPQSVSADTTGLARMALFPSGERPRRVTTVALGSDFRLAGARVPTAFVDEVVFGTDVIDHQLVVSDKGFLEGEEDLVVRPVRRTLGGDLGDTTALGGLPPDAGLLRLGEEIVAYDSFDAGSGTIHVPAAGRGLLGTDPQNHVEGTAVRFLEPWRVTTLAAGVGPADSELPLASPQGFPPEGTVLVDEELVHFTRQFEGALSMPRASEVPGAMDEKGAGLFRGRYGTAPASHAAGAPVILFPFRYWDRWAERADAPELAYLELALDQPDAFWKSSFWDVENAAVAGPRIAVLERARSDVPWDGDPEAGEGLALWDDGHLDRGGNAIGAQSDRIAWRVHVRYEPGSFDALQGLAHGWKTTPRLRILGAEYLAPNRVLRRVER
jgi:hypothetical protein